MATDKADLLLHPVRLRIVLESAADEITAGELARRLPDVAQATLYRHIATLTDAGVLEVVAERRVRGGVERTLRLVTDQASLDSADAASLSPNEHLSGFIAFVGSLVAAFDRYIHQPSAAPSTDPVSYRQVVLWLTDNETRRLGDDLGEVLRRYAAYENAPGRRRVRMSTTLVPDGPTADEPRLADQP
ncbi:MAG: helix-turn-helix domain-containing protein [Jiangellales bacterium]